MSGIPVYPLEGVGKRRLEVYCDCRSKKYLQTITRSIRYDVCVYEYDTVVDDFPKTSGKLRVSANNRNQATYFSRGCGVAWERG